MNNFPLHRKSQFSNSVNFGVYEFFMKLHGFWNSRICSTVTVGESWCRPLTQIIRMQILWHFVDKFHLICMCDFLTMHSVSSPIKHVISHLLSLSSAASCTVYHKMVLLTCSDKISITIADSLHL